MEWKVGHLVLILKGGVFNSLHHWSDLGAAGLLESELVPRHRRARGIQEARQVEIFFQTAYC